MAFPQPYAHVPLDQVDGAAFGLDAGSALLAAPLASEERRMGVVVAVGVGIPFSSDPRRRALFGNLCQLSSLSLANAMAQAEAVQSLHAYIAGVVPESA